MREPRNATDTALQHVTVAWDEARTERTLPGVHRKRTRRRVRTALVAASATALIVSGGILTVRRTHTESGRPRAIAARAPERSVGFVDGSQALLLDAAARVVVERASDSAIDVRLPAGRVRFEVTPHKARTFRVVCDGVVVQVLGTGFELTRDGPRTHVRVLHGRVAVTWPEGGTQLGAGQAGWFPPAPVRVAEPEPTHAEPERLRASSWRQHAEQGDFQKAYRILARHPARLSADVEELLLAADAARLSGHPAEAVPYLQAVTDRHADDPRAPLAAFTLGGVLMNQLGRPREAAAAYARARAMSPSSALSQDALARQVEAAHRAADGSAARALALEYLERYPNGRRVQAVRRFGGTP